MTFVTISRERERQRERERERGRVDLTNHIDLAGDVYDKLLYVLLYMTFVTKSRERERESWPHEPNGSGGRCV